ncbi:PREDICTED: BBSome-interacting protein 1-like [Branchiostoma belcheri]|uniref:BBSome-interacting protein 1-like n=1 Tax=Branchiostoma belcheri TaxID=7741 RepID=A0A6P5A1R6_BRABE|nr:PREDICTED: BBSome-interacting protein 1-like [Branchiostoma belcheri]
MPGEKHSGAYKEVLPKQGQLHTEDNPTMVLCKPKILPMKSVTLEKLDKMQREAQEKLKAQEAEQEAQMLQSGGSNNFQPGTMSDFNSQGASGEMDRYNTGQQDSEYH